MDFGGYLGQPLINLVEFNQHFCRKTVAKFPKAESQFNDFLSPGAVWHREQFLHGVRRHIHALKVQVPHTNAGENAAAASSERTANRIERELSMVFPIVTRMATRARSLARFS